MIQTFIFKNIYLNSRDNCKGPWKKFSVLDYKTYSERLNRSAYIFSDQDMYDKRAQAYISAALNAPLPHPPKKKTIHKLCSNCSRTAVT